MTGDEVARVEQTAVDTWEPAAGQANDALSALGRWVQAARNINELVAQLVDTPFVPDNYRPKTDPRTRTTPQQEAEARRIAIATATAAVLQGTRFGWDPLTSLQQIIVVHGRPSMYAEAMKALLIAEGHEIWEEQLTEHRAIVCGRRRGEDRIHSFTVTMEMARKAGWTRNEAYGKTPQDMLYARAVTRVCKRVAPEVLLGISSVEEVRDTIAASAQTGSGGRRTIAPPPQAALAAAAESAAPLPLPDEGDAPTPIYDRQWRDIQHELTRIGLNDSTGAADRLEMISSIVGRDITRGSELSRQEADLILAELRSKPTPKAAVDPATAEPRPNTAQPTGDPLLDDELPTVQETT